MSQNRGTSRKQYREAEKSANKPRKDLIQSIKKPVMESVDDWLLENVVEPSTKYGETAGKVGSGVAALGSAAVDMATPDSDLDIAMAGAGPLFSILRKGKKALKSIEYIDDAVTKTPAVRKYLKRVEEEATRSKYNKDYPSFMDSKRLNETRDVGVGAATAARTKDLKEDAIYEIEDAVENDFPELFDELADVVGVSSKRIKQEWRGYIDTYKDDHIDMISPTGFLEHMSSFGDVDSDEIFDAGKTAVEKLNKRLSKGE